MPEFRRLSIGVERGDPVTIVVDGERVRAYRGETVAAALLATGRRILRRSPRLHQPRGLYCGMGVCFDCVVTVDGASNARACMTFVEDGMSISTGASDHD